MNDYDSEINRAYKDLLLERSQPAAKVIINEKVFDIQEDVDMLYDNYITPVIDLITKPGKTGDDIEKLAEYASLDLNITVSSEILQTDACKRAHQRKPVKIECGVVQKTNYYSPALELIGIGVICPYLKTFITRMDCVYLEEYLTSSGFTGHVTRSFKPSTLKAVIAHELSHWMRDAETEHLDAMATRQQKVSRVRDSDFRAQLIRSILMPRSLTAPTSAYELDAYVHGLVEVRRGMGEAKWNKLTLTQLFTEIPMFMPIKRGVQYLIDDPAPLLSRLDWSQKGELKFDASKMAEWERKQVEEVIPAEWQKFQKLLVSRLAREDMLGDNMRTFDKLN